MAILVVDLQRRPLGPDDDLTARLATPMIAVSAALLFFATLLVQWKELSLQRRELRRASEVAEAQRRELAQQNTLQVEHGNEAWIISLTEAARQTRDVLHRPLIRLGVDRLAREAERDARNGMDLFRLFHATFPAGAEEYYDDALDERWRTDRPRYEEDSDAGKLDRMKSWFDFARAVVHHKDPSVYEKRGLLII
ncbi:MAG: hypothetical protein GY778_13550 [bacterium]|nr:hypothetical protein [bacterium]